MVNTYVSMRVFNYRPSVVFSPPVHLPAVHYKDDKIPGCKLDLLRPPCKLKSSIDQQCSLYLTTTLTQYLSCQSKDNGNVSSQCYRHVKKQYVQQKSMYVVLYNIFMKRIYTQCALQLIRSRFHQRKNTVQSITINIYAKIYSQSAYLTIYIQKL